MWEYTPRQIRAWAFLKFKRLKREAALTLIATAAGSRGEAKDVKKMVGKWSKGEDG